MRKPTAGGRGALLALVLMLLTGLFAGTSATAAHANTGNSRLYQINMHIDRISSGNGQQAADEYNRVISELRVAARGNTLLWGRADATETRPANDRHLIEIVFLDGTTHTASAYFRSDNLYLMGFWTLSPNSGSVGGHLGFTDQRADMEQILRRAGYNVAVVDMHVASNYDALGSDARIQVPMGPLGLLFAYELIANYDQHQTGTAAGAYRRAYLTLIQSLAEATRYDLIRSHVAANMLNTRETSLTSSMINWENSWSSVSRWMVRYLADPSAGGITVNHTYYGSPQAIVGTVGTPPAANQIGYMLTLGSGG